MKLCESTIVSSFHSASAQLTAKQAAIEAPIDLGCDYVKICEDGLQWDFQKCDCIPPQVVCDPGPDCVGNRTWLGNPECQCVCKPELESCPRGYYRHPEICDCFLTCDYIKICEAGYKWDFIECGCVANCNDPTPCWDGQPRDPTTCKHFSVI